MSEIPGDLKFLKSHEWARVEDSGRITVGISDHAQGLLGDLVYVELPNVGDRAAGGDGVAHAGQLDIDEVAEQALGVVGNADGDLAVVFDAGPLMGFEELQVAGDFAHVWTRVGRGRGTGIV